MPEEAATVTDIATIVPSSAEVVGADVDGNVLEGDVLVEEVSIDGMCGVY